MSQNIIIVIFLNIYSIKMFLSDRQKQAVGQIDPRVSVCQFIDKSSLQSFQQLV